MIEWCFYFFEAKFCSPAFEWRC